MSPSHRGCPAAPAATLPHALDPAATTPSRGCPAAPAATLPRGGFDPAATLPRGGMERAVMLALRYVAAAAETGDAACFDAAFDAAEDALGPRDGALLVGRAAALVRALAREGEAVRVPAREAGAARALASREAGLRFLPPPCRHLSPDEARLLAALRLCPADGAGPCPAELSGAARAALVDLAAPIPTAAAGMG